METVPRRLDKLRSRPAARKAIATTDRCPQRAQGKSMNRKISMTLAAAALFSPLSVFASLSSSATLGSVTITLVDLDPSDGVTPFITFTGGVSLAQTEIRDFYMQQATPTFRQWGSGMLGVASTSADLNTNHAEAHVVRSTSGVTFATGSTIVGSLMVQASNPGSNAPMDRGGHVSFSADARWNYSTSGDFTLSANTSVTFQATADVSIATTKLYADAFEMATATANFSVVGPGSDGTGVQYIYRTLYQDLNNSNGPGTIAEASSLQGVFINQTAGNMTGSFYATAATWGWTTASAVPEPSAYVMTMAGLGVIGWAARRRRSKALERR
jgi:hypothetical protein